MSDGVLKALITTEPEETNEPAWGRDGLTKSILDGLTASIAMLDDSGKIIFVNESWRRYAEASHLVVSDHLVVSNHGIGMNYLEVCESESRDSQAELREIANGIREIISGESDEFHTEYPCHSLSEKRWFSVRATRIDDNDPPILLLVYNDVTEQKLLEEEREKIKSIFQSIGVVHIIENEELLDAVTGLSGSGPAYVAMFIEALSDGGVKMGLPRVMALNLAAQTVYGTAKMVLESGIHPAELKDKVSSPGGTTIEGIKELEVHGLRGSVISAVESATRRSKELSKGGK